MLVLIKLNVQKHFYLQIYVYDKVKILLSLIFLLLSSWADNDMV